MSEIAGMLVSALGQGFIYAPMALGVFLTFSILKTPDLTVEGSFVFGMTSCVIISIAGHPILGLIAVYKPVIVRIPDKIGSIFNFVCKSPVQSPAAAPASVPAISPKIG